MNVLVDPRSKERFVLITPMPRESRESCIERARKVEDRVRINILDTSFGEFTSLRSIEVILSDDI